MTTVVAAAVDGSVAMAADTCNTSYDRPVIGGATKIVRMPAGAVGEVLFGFAGAGGLVHVVRDKLKVDGEPLPEEDPDEWASALALAVTDLAANARLFDQAGQLDGTLLLGWCGRVWTIGHAVAVPHPDGRVAIGSGGDVAIGALDALLGAGCEPHRAVRRACEIGIARDHYSAGPVQVHTLPREEPHAVR